jgi:hypothetical protein
LRGSKNPGTRPLTAFGVAGSNPAEGTKIV